MTLRVATRPGSTLLADQLRQQGYRLPEDSRLQTCAGALAVLHVEGLLSRAELRAARQRLEERARREAVAMSG